ncbi:MBL fold metallo-hydrolase [Cognatishimia sp. SS12]|uniref:MBL fold metallo-hydrolase n=1 Tax=Cognatishimia sp. SS12 TaxID=2979465 RepID=UPI00232EBC7D|nr:MBL fold metallo-hydrolase [Cognatishimia sp. SS12]MDC0739329.1 MBL fold metallo-hydrolase [Cognatishimia sp. SS12]
MKISAIAAGLMLASPALAADLDITVFNPGTASLFPVVSSIIEGPSEVILVDAQFQTNDAQTLVDMIKATGKDLKAIYITHKDPDFYFGLDTILAAFPDTPVYASPETVKGIKASAEAKLQVWGPRLKENAPARTVVPAPLEGDHLMVDGERVNVIGLDGHDPKHTFVHVPSEDTVIASISVFNNQHVWMADSQTVESRDNWRATLETILDLNAERIIPGHFVGDVALDDSGVYFTRDYIARFEGASAAAEGSEELIAAMQALYPDFGMGALGLSAKVAEGEATWP